MSRSSSGPLARPVYRTRQLLHALRPPLSGLDLELPGRYLQPEQLRLFEAMQVRDKRHVLEVAGRLIEQGHDEPDLIAAALLHDCAKGDVPVWMRVMKVAAPAALSRVARPGSGWRDAAHRLMHDAELSAALARRAGSSALTVGLIKGDAGEAGLPYLKLLQQADDAS